VIAGVLYAGLDLTAKPSASFGLSTAAWGFKSGKVIDDCVYLQVRDSNKCPEGDLNPLSHGPMSGPYPQ